MFVNLLRIPYAYMYPGSCASASRCYSVSNSVVDSVMLIMGGVGYLLRKLGYDLAPVSRSASCSRRCSN